MRKLFVLLLIAVSFKSYSQEAPPPGSIRYLDYKRGFKDIVLGSDMNSISGKLMLIEKPGPDSTSVYDYTDRSNLKIGEIELRDISVVTFKNKILFIMVTMDKKYDTEMLKLLTDAYGVYTEKPNQFMNRYLWRGSFANLSFDYTSVTKPSTLFFTDIELARESRDFKSDIRKQAIKDL